MNYIREKEMFVQKNDEKSVSPYKSPKLLALLSPKDNLLCIMGEWVAGVLSPRIHSLQLKNREGDF